MARETVSSGGVASGTVLSNTGLLTVSSGGRAVERDNVGSSGGLVVLSGGTASGATFSSGGVETLSGGTAIGTQVKSGATAQRHRRHRQRARWSPTAARVLVAGGTDSA